MAGGRMPLDDKRSAAWRNVETVIGAVVVIAFCNLVVTLLLGGYDTRVHGVQLKASGLGRPLFILAGALAARFAVSRPSRRALRGLSPWGILGAIAGLAAYGSVTYALPVSVNPLQIAVVGGIAVACFALAWLSYGENRPTAVRAIVLVAFVATAAGLGASHERPAAWAKTFGYWKSPGGAAGTIPADREGLLLADGAGVIVAKCNVGHDTRDAMVIAPNGASASKVSIPHGAKLSFSVAARRGTANSTLCVFPSPGSFKESFWSGDTAHLKTDSWQDVTVPLPTRGDFQIVFEVMGAGGGDSFIVANPRIEPAAAKGPNVVIFLIDALRADRLGVYGCARPTSPEIAALAARGVVFEDCIAQAPWTVPSITSLFTSLYPTAHGVQTHDSVLSARLATLTDMLRKHGYYTGSIQANPLIAPEMGFGHGFNEYDHLGSVGWEPGPKAAGSRSDIVADHAVKWLEKQSAQPFFLYVHCFDGHRPLTTVPDMTRFGSDESSMYDATIAFTSKQFARVMDALEALKLSDKTIVILTADHGEQFMEHGRDGHARDLHVEELRIPLIVWAPSARGRAGTRVKSVVRMVDLAPTILDLVGAEPLPYAEGASLAPALRGEELPARTAWSELTRPVPGGAVIRTVSLTDGAYRVTCTDDGTRLDTRYEVFDLAKDPAEAVNLSASRADLVAGFKRDLSKYLQSEQDLHAKLVPADERTVLTREQLEKLRALGYLDPE